MVDTLSRFNSRGPRRRRCPSFGRLFSSGTLLLCARVLFSSNTFGDPASGVIPDSFARSRYQSLEAHSPFAPAMAPATAPPATGTFAANWFVSGIGRIGRADFVTIGSRDLSAMFTLFTGEPDHRTNVELVSVAWSDTVGKSTVVLRQGNEIAQLSFNEAELRGAKSAKNAAKAGLHPASSLNASPPTAEGPPGDKLHAIAALRRQNLVLPQLGR